MTDVRMTYVGGPTALIEVGGWRLLTDPTFDPAGGRYFFGAGTYSRKLQSPALGFEQLAPVDAVLLSHDHHEDNLDAKGRELLPRMGTVVTTAPGATRLGGEARGLKPWETTVLEAPGKVPIEVTATPCRHGPPGSKPLVGDVIGFALRWEGQEHGAFWISGDTVLYDGVREVAQRFDVGTAVVHLGGVRFWWISGPLRYTMTAQDAVELCGLLNPRTILPIHAEGWRHFVQRRPTAEAVLAGSPLADRVRWLPSGEPTTLEV
ncbi:MBL fold metallo-hydrolase [Conexibacter sp. SYSU D00693]|uniref:MBL fold metallo-hydrolase n=1 Tax=Conexibacter sp. SYSU D00693 TaxID=2812560 RepID=UPI001F119C82|nr:MBL fold metallo-hydrolase [Conexibacter sp. SYSU D00693]